MMYTELHYIYTIVHLCFFFFVWGDPDSLVWECCVLAVSISNTLQIQVQMSYITGEICIQMQWAS